MAEPPIRKLSHAAECMGCGPANPNGLGIDVHFTPDGRAHGTVTFDRRHTGAPGYAHGGALAAALDDMLGQVLVILGRPAVTASLTVNYRAPVLLRREITITAWCERRDGRKLHLRAEAHDHDDVLADATALFIAVTPGHWREGGEPIDPAWLGMSD